MAIWEADVAGSFLGVRLGLPREQARALVAEAMHEELRNRAAGIDALVSRGRG